MITKKSVASAAIIFLGVSLIAIAFNMFLQPGDINSGSIAGLSIVINQYVSLEAGYIIFIFNFPILIWTYLYFGFNTSFKTLVAGVLQPVLIVIFKNVPQIYLNDYLMSIIGGIITGIGVSLLYYTSASTGGTAAIAQILSSMLNLEKGLILLILDSLIVISSLVVFPVEKIILSIISIVSLSGTVSFIQWMSHKRKITS